MSRIRANALHAAVWTVFLLGSLLQRPGQTTFDVKLDLTENPVGFLSRALALWTSEIDFGGVQNQAYGYLFPMGPWYAAGDLLGVAAWVTQRLWSGLLLIAAYEGARRLARALLPADAPRWQQLLAGLAYALTPRIFALAGVLTGEILPSVVLPWVCLPLVLHHRGLMTARRAGLLAGAAVLFMGGINATENLAPLLLPLLLVLAQWSLPDGRRLAGWWVLATSLACLWWMLPLLLLGAYGSPFLDYIETAAGTTDAAGWSNTVRGAEHWLGYIWVGGQPWWEAYWDLTTDTVLVLVAGVVAAVGLLGLFHPAMPLRRAFALSALAGLALMTAGHGGWEGTPLAGGARTLLDGPLAAFRNVHKFDPLVRLPLALGFAVAVGRLVGALGRGSALAARWRRLAAVAVSAALLVATGAPMLAGTLRHPGWAAVPQAWRDAGKWLEEQGPGATLVLPSNAQGQQTWGTTVDLPLQPLTSSAWVSRTQIPLIPPATIRVLDGIVDRLETGADTSGVARLLQDAGVTRVLVSYDADRSAGDVADPAHISAVLAEEPAAEHERSFGSDGSGHPLIEIFRVGAASGQPETRPTSGEVTVVGAPEDALAATDVDLVRPGEAAVVGGVPDGTVPDVVADGYRRVDREFGRFHDARGPVLSPEEAHRSERRRSDFAGAPGVSPVVATYGATVTSVTASSSQGYTDTVGAVVPALAPASAVDDDTGTYWRSAPFTDGTEQWVEIGLARTRTIGRVTVVAGVDGFSGTPVTRIAVSAGGRIREAAVDQTTGRAVVDLGGTVRASTVRVSTVAVRGDETEVAVALREIRIAGVSASRSLVVPDAGATAATSFLFTTDGPRRACQATTDGTTCDPASAHQGSEQGRIARTFTVHGDGRWRVRGTVVAQPGRAVARLLQPLGDAMRGSSASVLGDDPAVDAMFAVDGDPTTAWRAASGDQQPSIDLDWGTPRTIDRLTIAGVPSGATTPVEAVIEAGGETRTISLSAGAGWFEPLRATGVRITFRASPVAAATGASVGIGEITLAGTENLVHPVALDAPFRSECGLGPLVDVDGVVRRTRVVGTLRDVVEGRPLQMRSCEGRIQFGAGEHELHVSATAEFTPTAVVLGNRRKQDVSGTASRLVGSSGEGGAMDVTVTDGPESLLTFGQNANPGWRATLAGRELRRVTVDGWQQAFVVPAGVSGTVRIDFGPGATYVAALVAGGLAVVLLLALLGWDRLRPAPAPAPAPAPRRVAARSGLLLWLLALVAWAALAGPWPAALALLGLTLRRRAGWPWPLAVGAVAVLLSAVAAAYDPSGTPGALANMLAAAGVGLLASLVPDERRTDATGRSPRWARR